MLTKPMAMLDHELSHLPSSDTIYTAMFRKYDADSDKQLDAVELLLAVRAVMRELGPGLPWDCLAYVLVVLDVVRLCCMLHGLHRV